MNLNEEMRSYITDSNSFGTDVYLLLLFIELWLGVGWGRLY